MGVVRSPLQILTVAELLAGKKLEYPAHRDETFAKAAGGADIVV